MYYVSSTQGNDLQLTMTHACIDVGLKLIISCLYQFVNYHKMSLLSGSWKSFIVCATVVLPPFGCLSDAPRGQAVLGH
jgi:hypothetical protein